MITEQQKRKMSYENRVEGILEVSPAMPEEKFSGNMRGKC